MAYTGKKPVDFVDVTESQTFKVTESLDVQGNELVLDADGDTSITSDTDDVIDFRTAGSDRWQILANGNLKAATNGLGIDFSASEGSNASSSVLDDYEEGTWTPQIQFDDTNATTTVSRASYIKIGAMVHASATIRVASASSGTFEIASLPFSTNVDVETTGSVMTNNINYETGTVNVVTYQYNTTSKIHVYGARDNSTWYPLSNSHVSSGDQFIISHTYYIS